MSDCAAQWSLRLEPAIRDTPFSYVAFAARAEDDVVLKIVPPDAYAAEETTLRWYDGSGAARLLESDAARGALLLERIRPGEPATPLVLDGRDDEATLAFAGVIGRLWKATDRGAPVPELPGIEEDIEALVRLRASHNGTTGPIPARIVESAEDLTIELITSSPHQVVVHADLHHDNLLRSDRDGWLAIDPKGRIGDPACEAAALMRNPISHIVRDPDLGRFLVHRAELLAQVLQLSRERILAWTFVLAVVAACWQLEDDVDGWDQWIQVAQALSRSV